MATPVGQLSFEAVLLVKSPQSRFAFTQRLPRVSETRVTKSPLALPFCNVLQIANDVFHTLDAFNKRRALILCHAAPLALVSGVVARHFLHDTIERGFIRAKFRPRSRA